MPKQILGETLYSRTEIAEMLGVTPGAVTACFRRGLKAQTIGGTKYVTETNLKEFINQDS